MKVMRYVCLLELLEDSKKQLLCCKKKWTILLL